MRVAHVCRIGWPHLGGMESVVDGLSAALAARGHDVRVVTLDRALTDGSALPEAVHRGVRYLRVPRVGPRRYPFARGLLGAVGHVDVVHVHGLDGLADVLVRRRDHGGRVGISTHGGYFHTPRHRALKALWLRTVTRATLRRADAVWYTSEVDRAALAAARIPGQVLPDGVDTEAFAAVVRRPEPGRFLIPGRLDAHKGHDDLVEALAVLARVDPRPFVAVVVGPERAPGLAERIATHARARGLGDRVRVVGALPDLRAELARAELVLFPSRYEGFGVAVVEAMAARAPVVVSAIPAFDRLIRPGVDGFRIDFREPASAAGALAELRGRALTPVAEEGARSAARYGWSRVVLAWERAYQELLG